MKKRYGQIFVIAALILVILGSLLIKKGIVYMPAAHEFFSRPFYALTQIIKPKKRIERAYNDYNVSVHTPSATRYYEDQSGQVYTAKPDHISFYFSNSAAKIDLIGSELTNITMTPRAEGVWKWENEIYLLFTPKNDWPAGEEYTIKLPKEIFNPEFKMDKYTYDIAIPKFEAYLKEFRLYQDPKNPKIHQLQAIFSFSHPVDQKLFEKSLQMKADKQQLSFTVTYDALKRNAYVVSEPIKILTKDQTATVELADAKAATGGKGIKNAVKQSIDIPSQDKFFRISQVNAVIVRNEQEDPEQFIEINFTDGVSASELKDKIEVYLLPLLHPDKEQSSHSEVYDDDYEGGYYDEYDNYIEPQRYSRPYSYSWNFSEVTPAILEKSKKINVSLMEGASDISNTFMFKYNAPDLAKRYLYVSIKEGITSQIDYVIKKDYNAVLTSAAYPKELSLLQNGAILPLEGSKKLTFKTRGLNGAKVDIARVMPGQINHLVSQTYGSFANPGFRNRYDFDETNISQSFSEIIPLNIAIGKANYSSVDMNEYLRSQGSSGLFFVKIQGYNTDNGSSDGPADKRFILATDLGILVKKDNDGKHRVFVMSIKNGRPVSGAKVEILGKNGIAVLTQYTDDQGCAVFNKIEGFSHERQPVAYLVSKGSDISFLPLGRYDRQVDFSKFNTSGEYSSSRTRGMKAFVFSDRGIYRPGDDINFGVIVKNEEWGNLAGVPVRFVLRDPYSKIVFEKKITLNNTGFLTFDEIKTYKISPTGTYEASLYMISDNKSARLLGSAAIRVEEFRTDSIKVSAKITGSSGTGWTLPENLKAVTSANNFFGTPAQERMVKASYSLNPAEFRFSKYQGFMFPDPYRLKDKNVITSVSEDFTDSKTDENGQAEFVFDLSKFSGGTYNLTFAAEVFEGDSGKSVYAYDSVKVSPYKYLLGYKTIYKLDYLNKGSDAELEITAIDNNLKSIELKNVKMKAVQRQYISSLIKQSNGVYKYQSTVKENVIEEKALNLTAGVNKAKINTQNPGHYAFEIEDENGNKLLSVIYFVAGSSNQSLTVEKDANLMINLQDDDIEPGSQLTLNITAPYAGAGLITIEKDKVYAYKWFKADTNSSVQKITVPNTVEGNAYVNVSFIRSMDSKEIFSSPHSYAAVPFKISLAKRTVKIDLKTPDTVRPGEEIEISYKTSQDAKIVVYAVNQGILQVANYKTPNPLAYFFTKGALEVTTFQTVDLILPDYKIIREISGIGGGDGYEMIEKNLNPFARKQEAPVVFWSKTLDSSTQYKTVKYKVPAYFNGELKIMAVAANSSRAGNAETEVIVKSPVIISPIAPVAALPGDTFEVTATVSNNIENSKSATLEVWLESNDKFEITGTNKQTIEVKEGGEKIVRFSLKTLDSLGSGDLIFKAKNKNDVYKAEISVSVRPAYVYMTKTDSGISKKAKTKIDGFARNMYDEYANREIAVSYNPQLVFLSLKKYFNAYPYGCTEQIVSAAFPFIYSTTSDRKGFITAEEQQKLFENTFSRIRTRQLNSGAFSLWPDSTGEHIYATVYALHFFTDAKELDYPVPQEILDRGKNWLEYFASSLPTSIEDARLKAYANYVLTRNNAVTTNNLLRIEEYLNSISKKWQEDVVSAYMASCYALLKDTKKADALIKSFKADTKEKFIFYSDYDSSSQRNAAYLYLCNKHFANNLNPDAQAIADGLVQVILDGKYNTISSSYILLALLSYGSSMEGKDANIQVSEKDNAGKENAVILQPDPFPYGKFTSQTKEFTINTKEGLGNIYYSVIQQGFDRTAKEYSEKLEITRDYLDENGSVIKSAKLGDIITVRVRIRSKANDYVMVALVDLLPACFEIISGTQHGSYDSTDAREDRMIFYVPLYSGINELTYKVKAVTKGKFTVPGVYASGMYDPEFSALTKQSSIEVVQPGN